MLCVNVTEKPARELLFGSDWDDLTRYTEDIAYYSEPVPDDGYYWIDKTYRSDWTMYR